MSTTLELAGRRTLVTGATKGVGRAVQRGYVKPARRSSARRGPDPPTSPRKSCS
jgi:NAD(P)-dependent dehydrogenase (short-subunit alcohol dehydrogenase family)